MRLLALLVTGILTSAPAFAQAVQASPPKDAVQSNLPVSLDKIKEALDQPAPAELLRGLDERPHFRVEIRERQKIEELLESLKFDSGPALPGGIYGHEQQQNLWPKVSNPLAQPYAAFNQGQLLTIALENLFARFLGGRMLNSIAEGSRTRAEQEAREEVARTLAEFLAANPQASMPY